MPAALLDVIWIHDAFIKPPGPKIMVCVEPTLPLFYRINTEAKWQIPVLITKADNPFLKWDSYLEVGVPLEYDDYVIDQSPRHGRLGSQAIPDICAAVRRSRRIRESDPAASRILPPLRHPDRPRRRRPQRLLAKRPHRPHEPERRVNT